MKHLSRRDFLRITGITLGAGALAGCILPGSPSASAPAAEAPKAGLAEQKGVLWGLKYDPHVEAYNRLAKLFNEKTGAVIEVQPQEWPLEAKLTAALAAGTQPDVACMLGSAVLPLIVQGVILDVTDLVYQTDGVDPKQAYYGDAIATYSWKGKIYGVPTEMGGIGQVVNIPEDQSKELGLWETTPPGQDKCGFDSYEQMFDLAKKLQVEENGKVKKWGINSQGWDGDQYLSMVEEALVPENMHWYDPANETFNIDNEAGLKALQLLVETPVKMGIETQLDVNHVDACMSGRVAIGVGNGTPAILGWQQGYLYSMAVRPPILPNTPIKVLSSGGWGFVAPKQSNNQDISVAFLRTLDTTEGHKTWEQIYGGKRGPWRALKGVFDHFEGKDKDPLKEGRGYQMAVWTDHCGVWELSEFYGEGSGFWGDFTGAVSPVLADVRQKKVDTAEALKTMQANLKQAHQKFLDTVKQAGT